MERKFSLLLFLALAVGLTAGIANAELIAYEPFDYAPASDLDGQDGGTGWAGPWGEVEFENTGDITIQSGSLVHPTVNFPTSGNHVLTSETGESMFDRSTVETILDEAGAEAWISYLYQVETTPVEEGNWRSLDLHGGLGWEGFIGATGQPWSTDTFAVLSGTWTKYESGIPITPGQVYWIVVKIEMSGDNNPDTVYLWVDPDPISEPNTSSAAVTVPDAPANNGFNRVMIVAMGQGRYDEIRLATTFDDVVLPLDPRGARNPNPPNGADHIDPAAVLSWETIVVSPTFDVYFGTTSTPPLVSAGQSAPNYDPPGDMALMTTHYWKIDVWDGGEKIEGFLRRFTTGGKAYDPIPVDGSAVTIETDLSWTGESFAASYDAYFGTDKTAVTSASRLAGDVDGSGQVDLADVLVVATQWLKAPQGSGPSADLNNDDNVNFIDFAIVGNYWMERANVVFRGNLHANSYNPGTLDLGETYYWRIDQRDFSGEVIMPGEVWSFKMEEYPTFRLFSGACRHTRDPLRSLYDNALGWGRQDIFWNVLEPYAPNDSRYVWHQWELENYGDLVLAYNAKGAHLLPILCYGTDWAGGYRFIDNEHVVDWQNYVERVVDFLRKQRYNVRYFQIWNEPDFSLFWDGDIDTFMTNVHLPAAEVIHNLGCKVVFGGWVGNPSDLVDLLDAHNAWDSVDVLDMHYKGIGDWQYLRDAAAARGYNDMPIWETEVGFTTNLHYISNFYPRLFYWALTHNADVAPDIYKVFYYREWSLDDPAANGYHRTLYSGDNLWHLGTSLQTLGNLFDGGVVSPYTNITNNKSLSAEIYESNSSIEGFEVDDDPNWIVVAIHLMDSDVGNPDTDTIKLTYSEFTQAGDVNSIKRVDVAGYETNLSGSYDVNGLAVTVAVADDPASPVQGWGLDGSVYNFYVVVTRDE